jgi:hypothetical protein
LTHTGGGGGRGGWGSDDEESEGDEREALKRAVQSDPAGLVGPGGQMLAGAMAGSASWLLLHPVDVVKSLVQSSDPGVRVSQLIRQAWSQSGPRFFLRGITASVVRAAPVSAVVFPIYEFLAPRINAMNPNVF